MEDRVCEPRSTWCDGVAGIKYCCDNRGTSASECGSCPVTPTYAFHSVKSQDDSDGGPPRVGRAMAVTGYLRTEKNVPVISTMVSMSVNGRYLAGKTTDMLGFFKIVKVLADNLVAPPSFELTLTAAEASYSTVVDIGKADVALTLERLTPDPIKTGQDIRFSGRLTRSSDGVGLGGKEVTLVGAPPQYENSSGLGTAVTAADGTFTFTYPAADNVYNSSYANDLFIIHALFNNLEKDTAYERKESEKLLFFVESGTPCQGGIDPSECYSSWMCDYEGLTFRDGRNLLECKTRTDCQRCWVKTGETDLPTRIDLLEGAYQYILPGQEPRFKFQLVDENGNSPCYPMRLMVRKDGGAWVEWRSSDINQQKPAFQPVCSGWGLGDKCWEFTQHTEGMSLGTYEFKATFDGKGGLMACESPVATVVMACKEGSLRGETQCWDGSSTYGEVCRGGVFVPSDEGCPSGPKAVTLTLWPEYEVVYAGFSQRITGTLVDEDGEPLPGAEVRLEVGLTPFEVVTAADGTFNCEFTVESKIDMDVTVTAFYDGDLYHMPAQSQTFFEVLYVMEMCQGVGETKCVNGLLMECANPPDMPYAVWADTGQTCGGDKDDKDDKDDETLLKVGIALAALTAVGLIIAR